MGGFRDPGIGLLLCVLPQGVYGGRIYRSRDHFRCGRGLHRIIEFCILLRLYYHAASIGTAERYFGTTKNGKHLHPGGCRGRDPHRNRLQLRACRRRSVVDRCRGCNGLHSYHEDPVHLVSQKRVRLAYRHSDSSRKFWWFECRGSPGLDLRRTGLAASLPNARRDYLSH
jgi:hypothetical protein